MHVSGVRFEDRISSVQFATECASIHVSGVGFEDSVLIVLLGFLGPPLIKYDVMQLGCPLDLSVHLFALGAGTAGVHADVC